MFKKILSSLVAVMALAAAGSAHAQYCGGTVMDFGDCSSNVRAYAASCCPSGYRVQGVAYDDINKADFADAFSAVCRSTSKGNDMMPTDFQRAPITLVCDNNEVFAGLACKDMSNKGSGKNMDASDGCTAICQNVKTGATREIYNPDIAGNKREAGRTMVKLPKRVVGIVYKDQDGKDDGVANGAYGGSDRADCAAIVVK
jgi:hypothetical protein